MKQYIPVDSYKVIDSYLEHMKRMYKTGSNHKTIKPKYYFRYGYTVRSKESPRYSNYDGGGRE